jgi:hypothetical protein
MSARMSQFRFGIEEEWAGYLLDHCARPVP